MSKMDERTKSVLQKYLPPDYPKDDAVWPLERKQKDSDKKIVVAWIAKHKALEVIAAHNGVQFDTPIVYEGDSVKGIVSILVVGRLGDKMEWSIGEAAPSNYKTSSGQPSYPWAMAEKRAKDRVILKIMGLHGDVYSEEEADEFKIKGIDKQDGGKLRDKPELQIDILDNLMQHIDACNTLTELEQFNDNHKTTIDTLHIEGKDDLRKYYTSKRNKLIGEIK